ncbi:methyltransferase domain-containing protein [Nocardiopsis sp. FIRDI 009]|uniref:methyltransferase domain-containing protein n=1 Tax=Nocardiopsis sp. FIRDI 009 TaxID=714197 RepID=UPI000E23AEE8|nr:class I SAM-dependent methyltransferase [Nocardiopsis sp. FIRDI 009]
MNAQAERVVESYRHRAAWMRAEARPTTPHLLSKALDGATHVTEFPCGAGHFLNSYAKAGVRVRLVDASWPMLTAATHHARETGVVELALGCHFLHQLPDLSEEDLVVVPNAALNQLTAQTTLPDVLTLLRRAVRPGTRLLLQHLTVDMLGCGFYTPTLADGHQIRDHRFRAPDGQEVTRYRRQHHTHDRSQVRIEFTYTSPGQVDHTTHVNLALPSAAEIETALTNTGWTTTHTHTRSGFREVLATARGSR